MAFIMLKKKSFTVHLLLANPTAVFLDGGQFKFQIFLSLSVNSFMCPKVSYYTKTLPTLFTFIRLFSSVNSSMNP